MPGVPGYGAQVTGSESLPHKKYINFPFRGSDSGQYPGKGPRARSLATSSGGKV